MRFASWLSSFSRSTRLSFAKLGRSGRARRRHHRNRVINPLGGVELLEDRMVLSASPVFGSSSYSFSVGEDAAMNATVGAVSATDADDRASAH